MNARDTQEDTTATSHEARPPLRDRDVDDTVKKAVSTLEEDIVLGYLNPRERLVVDDRGERFGLKRHVVRQVLMELERMGLVERRKNIGALVKSHTEEEVLNLYAVRDILEGAAAACIPLPLDAAVLAEIEAIQRAHDAAVARSDLRAVFRANVDFHRTLFAATRNPELAAAISEFAQRANAIRQSSTAIPEHLENARQEHWQIIEALRQGQRDRLVALCRQHLLPSRDNYIQRYRMLHPEPEGRQDQAA
jgi:DNA-binding GntR family transcriptional regulator